MMTFLIAAVIGLRPLAGDNTCAVAVGSGSSVRELTVEAMRCSAMPVNIRWPGHQRELDQTEICHFARFDFRGETQVRVTVPEGTREVVVRPVAKKVAVSREGNAAVFTLKTPGAYSVEFDGRHRNLMVFADPPQAWPDVDRTAANVRWFGPGEHDAGVIRPKAGETIFLDEGAVVYGRIEARDADGLRICGRGILDASRVKEVPVQIDQKLAEEQSKKGWAITNVERFDAIRLMFCDDARIEGITVRDSQIYAVRPVCCDRFTVDNVKILGSWRYNSDGIDMHNCRHVRIRDSFIRTFDDSICVKGFDYVLPESEMLHEGVLHDVFENVLVERCTIWNDWGHALEIGAETRAKEIRDVTFRDCDVLALHNEPLDVHNCDQAHIHDIVFENIRVEYDPAAPKAVYSASAKDFNPTSRRGLAALVGVAIPYFPEYSKAGAENRGRTSNVAFRDIDVFAPSLPSGLCRGFDADHRVTGVTFANIRLNGRDATAEFRAKVVTNEFADLAAAAASDAERNNSTEMNAAKDVTASSCVKGGVRVLFLGNSITLHSSLPKIGWTNVWGMAASAKEKDYVHLVTRGIETKTGRKADLRVRNLATFERNYRTWDIAKGLADVAAFDPDYLVVALGENVPNLATAEDRLAYRAAFKKLLGFFMEGRAERPNAVVRGVFWPNPAKDSEMAHVASDYAVPFVRADLGSDASMTAKGLFWHGGVQNHPGDKGMAAIADLILKALFPVRRGD